MPFGTCTGCDHFFALDTERSPQTLCPRCGQPLRLLPRGAAMAALRRFEARRPAPPASPAVAFLDGDSEAQPNIPSTEMAILAKTIVEVVELAVNEHRDEGCTCLINALCYAEQRRVAGKPWGELLVQRYHDVLDTYTLRYAVGAE